MEIVASLPVELAEFQATDKHGHVRLDWRTASETNNEGFDIQRSADGKNWNDLAFVPGHGTTDKEQSYNWTDERPLPGLNYYRLQQVDFDGKSEYSKIVSVEMKNGGSGIHFFPNPATGSVTLALETEYSGEAILTLYDLTGKQMKTATLSLEGGAFRTDLGLGSLPTGIYMAQVQAGGVLWRERLVVE
ncbi:MAG: T9SS type A sorting domain-containing protein [Saprospiraceae bacterium]|nr:T9SS type A sorting domain-containing protein [Saprospiraceae bacterium]